MILKELTINNIGPFTRPTKIAIDSNSTALTGSNDTGKSFILRTIENALLNQPINEEEVNSDRIYQTADWRSDREIYCDFLFEMTEISSETLSKRHKNADKIEFRVLMAPNVRDYANIIFHRSTVREAATISLTEILPKAISIKTNHFVGDQVDLSKPNPVEKILLKLAFGEHFSFEQVKSGNQNAYYNRVSKAEEIINKKIVSVLPKQLDLKFKIVANSTDKNMLTISIQDGHGGHTPINQRGAGIKSIISILLQAVYSLENKGHAILLLDEPENSLHADSQHALRRFLVALSSNKKFQTVYATHSPCMLDSLNPNRIRLLYRSSENEIAMSLVDNEPYKDNFNTIRACLGISIGDSLCYGPITIITEGITEILTLASLFDKLEKGGIAGFEGAKELLSNCHLIDGCGDDYSHICHLAVRHGSKTIVLLDGDKKKSPSITKLLKTHPATPVILLSEVEEGTRNDSLEYEELIPKKNYLKAASDWVSQYKGENISDLILDEFNEWFNSTSLNPRMAFSKKVDNWLSEIHDVPMNKPILMMNAIEITSPEEIHTESLNRLMGSIKSMIAEL